MSKHMSVVVQKSVYLALIQRFPGGSLGDLLLTPCREGGVIHYATASPYPFNTLYSNTL